MAEQLAQIDWSTAVPALAIRFALCVVAVAAVIGVAQIRILRRYGRHGTVGPIPAKVSPS